jgi:hypothetical protein
MAFERFRQTERVFAVVDRLRIRTWHWVGLSVAVVVADIFTGPGIQFPVLEVVPVMLAAWFSGERAGLALAVLLPGLRLAYGAIMWEAWLTPLAGVNAGIRVVVFALLAFLTSFASDVRVLRGLLGICSHCKKIRDADGSWQTLEGYMERHSEALFSHGVCPECLNVHYPGFGGANGQRPEDLNSKRQAKGAVR